MLEMMGFNLFTHRHTRESRNHRRSKDFLESLRGTIVLFRKTVKINLFIHRGFFLFWRQCFWLKEPHDAGKVNIVLN